MEAKQFYASQNILGEGPLWNVEEQAIYWVDISGKKIQRFFVESGKYEAFDTPLRVGSIAFREQGGLICGTEQGFYFWDTTSQTMEFIAHPEQGKAGARFNDGKVDRQGRFWAGTMTPQGATSALYRLDPDLKVTTMLQHVTISNGTGWSPDNTTIFYADSNRHVIYTFDFDPESGTISNQQPFVKVDPDLGVPDGLTVDSEGYVWCAIYDGWKVIRYSPDGKVDAEVRLPVSRPSSCMFGGRDLDQLFITSIAEGLTPEQKEKEPQAGDLFVVKTSVHGLPEPKFKG